MSNQALRWAWGVPTPATCKLVLARLADMADAAGTCWPSLGRIAADTGLTARGARKAIAELERLGVLRRDLRQSSSTLYRLDIRSGDGEECGSSRNDVPPLPEQCSSPSRNAVPAVPEHGSARTLIDPSGEEPSREPSTRTPREPAGFAEFWAAYPNKMNKADARKAFAKAIKRGANTADIMLGLRVYPFSPDGVRFIPHGATWLNNSRWEGAEEAAAAVAASPRGLSARPGNRDWMFDRMRGYAEPADYAGVTIDAEPI